MKYAVSMTVRASGSAKENEAAIKRSLALYEKWTPSATFHQFVTRVDGSGGFAVAETDDPSALARDLAVFSPYLDFVVYPVLDLEQSAGVFAEGVMFRESI